MMVRNQRQPRSGRWAIVAGVAMMAIVLGLPASLGTAAEAGTVPGRVHYPVPATAIAGYLAAGKAESTHPGAPPPGADIWSCKPSAAHPDPVVLVHGLGANMTDNWAAISPLLADAGYCVYALTYGTDPRLPFPFDQIGGLVPQQQSAHQLGAFVDRVLAATGAKKVDLVGHSEGATMPNWWIKFDGGARKVARYVGLAPVVHGTKLAGISDLEALAASYGLSDLTGLASGVVSSACGSCTQFLAGSSWIDKLDASGITARGIEYTQIVTRYDEAVEPYTSGEIFDKPNVTNIVLQDQCSTDYSEHVTLAFDPVAEQDILNALDPATAKPVNCSLVLP